ncbi:unnamed protein product [Protopolystoma xenopodis]|uniref:Uncharacterized protein n=1 Tax=Protopolystoma xenopodis TaxID=117903 RepID=A0A448XFL6_9PLAT|nr:unnamed protein product [Protopolystoma xenopodis]
MPTLLRTKPEIMTSLRQWNIKGITKEKTTPFTSQLAQHNKSASSLSVVILWTKLRPRQRDKWCQYLDKRSAENGYAITPLSVLAHLPTFVEGSTSFVSLTCSRRMAKLTDDADYDAGETFENVISAAWPGRILFLTVHGRNAEEATTVTIKPSFRPIAPDWNLVSEAPGSTINTISPYSNRIK